MVFALNWETIDAMARDTALALHALSYVIRLHADLTSEHGAPTLGTQNQAVDFILADPAAGWRPTKSCNGFLLDRCIA